MRLGLRGWSLEVLVRVCLSLLGHRRKVEFGFRFKGLEFRPAGAALGICHVMSCQRTHSIVREHIL